MKVVHYRIPTGQYRWRIEDNGEVLVRSVVSHPTLDACKTDVYIIGDFLAALIAERTRAHDDPTV